MRLIMKIGAAIHARLIRLTGKMGAGAKDGALLLLTHTGAKTGKVRQTPLMFFNQDGGYVVVASKGGLPENPAWYSNLKASPATSILVDGKDVAVTAEPIPSGDERDRLYARMVELNPDFAKYEEKTARTIPVVKFKPRAS